MSQKDTYTTALKLISEGSYQQAELMLNELVKSGHKSVEIYMALGDCARKQGDLKETAWWYNAAVDRDPDNFAAQSNYGLVLRVLKLYENAEHHCRKATTINPESSHAFGNLGLVLIETQNYQEAAACFTRALALGANDMATHCYLIRSLLQCEQLVEVAHAVKIFLDTFPVSASSYNALGNIYADMGKKSIAKDYYVLALKTQPDNVEAYFNLGTIMRQWNKLDETLICFNNVLKFNPGNALACVNVGEVYQVMGEHTLAEKYFNDALKIDPDCKIAYDNILVSMNYNVKYECRALYDAHVLWGASAVAALPPFTCKDTNDRSSKIRIGYVSPDFCKHPAASFLEPVIANHNRDHFEIFCYYQRCHDDDERTQKFRLLADNWREITQLSDLEAVNLIRSDKIDILVDCTGHMAGNRLGIFARRAAAIQISGFGYPSTTGLPTIDYRISDYSTDPIDTQYISGERLLRIDKGFFCYMPPNDVPNLSKLPYVKNGYMTFGSLHTTARLNREVIALWADLLNAVEGSRLIVFRTTLSQSIVKRLSAWFIEAGVQLERIDFKNSIETGGHLSVYDSIDCSLDTFPWSGHTTACESLWMGVPIITLRGDRHAGRMVTSLLEHIGLTDFIADSRNAYVNIAKTITGDRDKLVELRSSLRQRMLDSSVCNAKEWVRSFEKVIEEKICD